MGVEVLESALETDEQSDEAFADDAVKSPRSDVDARRRLEDKLEEIRLQKELREYDFDI